MTGDAETLAEWFRHSLRLYMLPSNVATYHAATDDHETVAARGADFLAEQLLASDWLAAVRDEAAREAWDEGHRLTAPHSDACEPTCPNPYRAAALRAAPPTEAIPEELWEQEHAAYRAEQDTEPTEGES